MFSAIRKNYNHTIYACYIGYITQAIVNNFVPLLFLTFATDYQLSLDRITLITTINFLVQLLVDLLAVKVVDKIGYRPCLIFGHMCAAVGLVGLAFLPQLFGNAYAGVMSSVVLYAIVTEATAGAVGLTVLFAFILCAVPLYIYCGFKNQPYEFLDKNVPFELEYGVKGLVTERKNAFRPTYIAYNIIATCVCIFSVVPVVLLSFSENEILVAAALALLMIIAGIGAGMFIVAGTQNASIQKLLKEGDFTEKEKKRTSVKEIIGFCYWGVLTAIYLAVSFLNNQWHLSWIIFAVGGVLFPVVMCICNYIADKDNKD